MAMALHLNLMWHQIIIIKLLKENPEELQRCRKKGVVEVVVVVITLGIPEEVLD